MRLSRAASRVTQPHAQPHTPQKCSLLQTQSSLQNIQPTMAGKKDKKKVDKKTRVAEKTARKTAQKEKKSTKKGKNQLDDEPEDVDLDQVLEEYARQVPTNPTYTIPILRFL